ncbi:MFS transporter [Paenibacillus sp. Marseille-Q4541]|uniref:MFS transporter n=1 Tax=Paenibacillus sp. Marseille-Q4541 TaxID=2831522 RepID=UPI001BA893D4|nr:MFS transporter [Paenibacillus sp. Marseille-Q4541]
MINEIRSFHPNIRARMGIVLISSVASNMILPFMSIYLARSVGTGLAGLILSLGIILNFTANLIGGYCSDTIGRKNMMIFSEVIRLFSYLLMLISNMGFQLLMILGFLLSNIASGFFSPASDAMLLDVTSSKERKSMYSYMYWIMNFSMALGGLLGTLLFTQFLIYLCAGLVLASCISLGIIFVRITETYKPNPNGTVIKKGIGKNLAQMMKNYATVWKDKVFMVYISTFVLLFSLESHFSYYVAVRFEQQVGLFQLSPLNFQLNGIEMFGLLRLENTIFVILFSIMAITLTKKWTDRGWMFLGISFYIIGYVCIVFLNNSWLLVAMMAFAVLGEALFAPIYETYLSEIPPKELRSTYMAVNKIALKLSTLIGSFGIFFVNVISSEIAAIFLLIVGVLAVILISYILPNVRNHNESAPGMSSES